MKLVLNTWLAFQTEGAAEAAALAQRLGVSDSALSTPCATILSVPRPSDQAQLVTVAAEDSSKDAGKQGSERTGAHGYRHSAMRRSIGETLRVASRRLIPPLVLHPTG